MAIERVGIVGSGIMGSGIAEVAAKAGATVVLRSRKQEHPVGLPVTAVLDYHNGERLDLMTGQSSALTLPPSDVLLYELNDQDWFCVRPSGTEPKIKIYTGVCRETSEEAQRDLDAIGTRVQQMIEAALSS